MMKKLICVLTLALLMIGGISTVKAQDLSGRDFWFSIPSNNGGTAAGNSYYFYAISPYCITNAVLEIPQLNYRTTFNITPGQYTQITLPNNVAGQPVFHTADRQVQKKGIHVFANQPMSLYAVVYSQASVDGEIILPTDKLGTEYVITGRSYGGNNPSRATIFATENGTAVTIKTWTLGNTSMAPSVQQTLTVNLNAGETYMFSRSSYNCNQDHSNAFTNQIDCATLTGSVITSNKPVGVISHTECSGFIACGACDVLMAQLLPTNQWGSEYVTAQVQKRNAPAITCLAGGTEAEDFSGDVLEIVGEVGTNVTIRSTSGTTTRTIAAPAYGNYGYGYLFWQNPPNPGAEQYSESNCIISSDKPVQILQYSRGYQSDAVPTGFPPQVTGNTDPESIVVYPRSYWQDSYLLATLAPLTSPITRAIIVVNDIGTPLPTTTIQLNGAAVAGPWQSFGQVDANNNWKFTRVNTPVLNTSTLVSTAGYKFSFYLTAVGQAESYALQGGQFFDITACTNCPIADIIVPKETCPNVPVTFTNRSQPGAGGSPLPTSYEWDFGDGSPIVTTTTVSDVTHTYTTGGVFNVTMTVTFAGPPICKEKVTYPITVFPVININAGQDALTCPGVAVNLGGAPAASGGTGALAYSWTPATALNSSIIPNPVSTPSATTTYTLEVTDSRGCKNSDQVLVTVNPPSSASLTPGGTICTGESFEFTVNITGGGNYDIVVTDGAGNNINLNNIPNGHKFTVTPSGTTDYRITSISRAGSNFCMTFDPVNQRVTVRPTPGLNISNGGTICSGSSFPMTATFTQTGTWNYSFSDGTNTTNRNNNSAATSNFTVSPTSTTTYTVNKVEYANAPLCTVNPNKTFTITVNNIPNPGVGSNITICKSATPVDLSTRFQTAPDPGGSFVDVSSSGALTGSIFNPASAAIGSYTIEHVVPGASPCPSAKSVFTINVVGPPQVTNIVENCDATLSSFTVRGTVTGGDPSTYSSSGGTFSQSGGTWTFTSSTSYPTKSNYTINIDDANQCGPTTISGFKNCGCLTNSGTMSTAVVEKCETDPAVATHNNNAVMLASDVLRFYLHEGSGLSLQGIIDSATTPSFSFRPGMIYGQTYYISAVAGPNLNNFPDRSSDCISISQGTPIRFFRQVTGSMTGVNSICVGSSSALQFTFSGIGPFTAEVSDGTSNTTYNALSATDSKLVTPGQTTD
ncbi:MAG TPA: PKD domain-containing protein, partial [Luteibaculaceae bacterium]|nr:PKD domain-containing protein [Luteibaculaceae bacterium]